MQKPEECPKCKSKKILRIAYGFLTPDTPIADDEFPGGCCVTDLKWHCAACRWEWDPNGEGSYNKDNEEY